MEAQLISDTHSEAKNTCTPLQAHPRKSSCGSLPDRKLTGKKRGRKSLSKEEKEARKLSRKQLKNEPSKLICEKERSKSDNYVIAPSHSSYDHNQRVEKICS